MMSVNFFLSQDYDMIIMNMRCNLVLQVIISGCYTIRSCYSGETRIFQ